MAIDPRIGLFTGAVVSYVAVQATLSYLNLPPTAIGLIMKQEDSAQKVFAKITLLMAETFIIVTTLDGRLQHHDQWQRVNTIKKICISSLTCATAVTLLYCSLSNSHTD